MQVKTNYFNNTKIINRMNELDDLIGPIQIKEFGDSKSDIITHLDFRAANKSLLERPLSHFEIIVMDAVYTLAVHGKHMFTVEMIANVIAGKEVGKDKTSTRFQMIEDTIERLRFMEVTIDFSNILKMKGIVTTPDLETQYSDYVLPLSRFRIKSRVKKIDKTFYMLKNVPVLYKYAEYLGRIINVPSSLLAVPNTREDELFSVLKREIIKTVAIMKNTKNRYSSRTITYEWKDGDEIRGLFERIGLRKDDYANDGQWRKRKSKINTMITQILDHMIEENYIDGYGFNKNGGSIVGVSIDIGKNSKKQSNRRTGNKKTEELGTKNGQDVGTN